MNFSWEKFKIIAGISIVVLSILQINCFFLWNLVIINSTSYHYEVYIYIRWLDSKLIKVSVRYHVIKNNNDNIKEEEEACSSWTLSIICLLLIEAFCVLIDPRAPKLSRKIIISWLLSRLNNFYTKIPVQHVLF